MQVFTSPQKERVEELEQKIALFSRSRAYV